MTLPAPFAYPLTKHERRHGPAGYETYSSYKPWLRDEFIFKCVYCLQRELWAIDWDASFSVEHIIPQSENPTIRCDYTNLVYACTRCNSARGTEPILDPSKAAFGDHIRLTENGLLEGLTIDGKDLIDLLHLNEDPALFVRRKYLRIHSLKATKPDDAEIDQLFLDSFGYPQNMPDLRTLLPPQGNKLKGSEETCYFARLSTGELDQFY
jgi:hypothetical protein